MKRETVRRVTFVVLLAPPLLLLAGLGGLDASDQAEQPVDRLESLQRLAVRAESAADLEYLLGKPTITLLEDQHRREEVYFFEFRELDRQVQSVAFVLEDNRIVSRTFAPEIDEDALFPSSL